MAQRKPQESARVRQVLKLVEGLAPEERDEVVYQLKLEDLRREIQKGVDSAERGDLCSEEDAMAFLEQRRRQRLERQEK